MLFAHYFSSTGVNEKKNYCGSIGGDIKNYLKIDYVQKYISQLNKFKTNTFLVTVVAYHIF